LAGPLIAAAVILPPGCELPGLRDSKMCTRLQRERLAEQIREVALAMAIVRVHHSRIDKVGLQRSNLDALRRAVKNLETQPDYVIFDCFRIKRLRYPSLGVKKGDAVSKNVAAASIVAKVHRDAIMKRYHRKHPQYGFATNVGYGTRQHWNALIAHGPSPVHRLSFFGVVGFPDEHGVVKPHKARDFNEVPTPPIELEEEYV
jgi:ribonuclease HII